MILKKNGVFVCLLSSASWNDESAVLSVLIDFYNSIPERIRPTRYGLTKVNKRMEKKAIKRIAAEEWCEEMHFAGNGTEWSLNAKSWFGPHSYLNGWGRQELQSDMILAAQGMAVPWLIDFGAVTTLSEPEIDVARQSNTASQFDWKHNDFILTIASRQLKMYIPDLYWQTYFGRPYIDMFGRERLLSAPVFKSEELSDGLIRLQLTESLDDMYTNHDLIMKVREKAKQHLKKDAFFNPKKGEKHKYVVPRFV